MSSLCVILASLLVLALVNTVDAASMIPIFEKSLGERLATRKATIDGYPALKYVTYLPETVDKWRELPLYRLTDDISGLQDSVQTSLPKYVEKDPANAVIINKFVQDCKGFIVFYEAGVQSGEISDDSPTTTPSTTRPPTKKSESSSFDEQDAGAVGSPYTPITYEPYTLSPAPAYHPMYTTYTYEKTLNLTKVGLVFALVMIAAMMMLLLLLYITQVKRPNSHELLSQPKELPIDLVCYLVV